MCQHVFFSTFLPSAQRGPAEALLTIQSEIKLTAFIHIMTHSSCFKHPSSSRSLPPVLTLSWNECSAGVNVLKATVLHTKCVVDGQFAGGQLMKLTRQLLATLAYFLRNKVAAVTSRRRLQSSAACSDQDSFYFDTTFTLDDATLSGCYAVETTGAEANDVHVFTVNGGEQAEGDFVFFATSTLSDDNLVSFVTMNILCGLLLYAPSTCCCSCFCGIYRR